MRRQLIIAGFTVLACGLVLLGLIFAGRLARGLLQTSERYQISFLDIECPTPPGLERQAFLREVRYGGEMPEAVSTLDESLRVQLTQAFARHPWVDNVERVDIGPGNRVQVALVFRKPVLAVVYADGERRVRAVDGLGILLPRGADTHALPHMVGPTAPTSPGRPWGDPQVEGAAKVAALLHPHQAKINLSEFLWENGALRLRRDSKSGPTFVWGRPPDDKSDPPANVKLRRLLDRAAETGDVVVDLRSDS